MEVIRSMARMKGAAEEMRAKGVFGLVPTMGALHEGHLALIRRAKRECGGTVVSIFVNPIQFGPAEDFQSYPRPLEHDLSLCEREGVDLVFHPDPEEVFPQGYRTYAQVEGLSEILCGASRPTHFRGVATVVLKLFNIVTPHRAYFGEKDYQQLVIVRQLARDLNLPVEVVGVPTVRDEDGLALSSRNQYLSREERQSALSLCRGLLAAREAFRNGERRAEALEAAMRKEVEKPGIVVEYAQVVDPLDLHRLEQVTVRARAVIAARIGKARLIDNMLISEADETGSGEESR